MDPLEYGRMASAEDEMWWYAGAHAMMLRAYRNVSRSTDRMVVDAGCGTGGFLRRLRAERPTIALAGIDLNTGACQVAAQKSGVPVVQGSVARLPFPGQSTDVVFSVDVLCHANVDPRIALEEARRCLRPAGRLIVNVPAYTWLRSAHDRRVHNARRFTRRSACALLRSAGFDVVAATYWNVLLFPLMVAHRLTSASSAESDTRRFPAFVDRVFRATLAVERRMIGMGIPAPFGGSILLVAVKA